MFAPSARTSAARLGFGTDVPHLPGRPGLLHGGQHPVGGLRDPVGVGHAQGFCGRGMCRRLGAPMGAGWCSPLPPSFRSKPRGSFTLM